jgi:nitroimidazol reductase NimA-like FMN-containing flavoprotein (pyridoxamine 5'-phosphate oxidase superfamily)
MPYHMKRSEKAMQDPEAVRGVLRRGKFVTVAMCRRNEPYLVTLSYGYDEEGAALCFHAANEGLKLEFLRENPRVCATVVEDLGYRTGECEQGYRSVVLRGKMFVVKELDGQKRGMEVLLGHLEDNPRPLTERLLGKDGAYEKFAVLRLEIEEIAGKEG